ncbi:SbtR family transcriptional regulator [Nocardia sp. NPDC003963]
MRYPRDVLGEAESQYVLVVAGHQAVGVLYAGHARDEVTGSVATLLAAGTPEIALRAWLDRYARFVATKRGLAGALRAGGSTGGITTPATRERITAAIGTLLAAGADTGALRADIDAGDVTALLLGVFLGTATDETPDRIGRLLDLVVDALRRPVGATTTGDE